MSAYTRRYLRVECKRPYAREMRRFGCAFRLRTYGVRSVNPALVSIDLIWSTMPITPIPEECVNVRNAGSTVHRPLLNTKWMLPNSTIVLSMWFIIRSNSFTVWDISFILQMLLHSSMIGPTFLCIKQWC